LKYNLEKIIKCVPNFSIGPDKKIIKIIADSINSIENSYVLDIFTEKSTNRSVITFITSPNNFINSAFNAIKVASENINMENHKGVHPRIGAIDVFPIIPIKNISLTDCIDLSNILAKKISYKLSIPVYLYGYSAKSPERVKLENLRKGEYENLKYRIKNQDLIPDYGKNLYNKKSGASIIGVRDILIAYNVNLISNSKKVAQNIAKKIRESGYIKTDNYGNILYDKHNKPVRKYGKLKYCKAIGWYSNQHKKSQVSFNITNFHKTPLHTLFDLTSIEARKNNIEVSGSEIVGLVSKEALLNSGKFYNKKCNGKTNNETKLIKLAIEKLGLNDLSNFNFKKKIIENFI